MIDTPTLNWQKNPDGLLPVIVQDADTAQVLMLGYINRDALKQTVRTKQVTFYSRSKKRLWTKGETSGNTLGLVDVKVDCDGDALLIQARPQGPTCHNGARSCFGDSELPLETLGVLMRTISERSLSGDSSSYTKQLLNGGADTYGAKILEEAEEVVRAAKGEGKKRTAEEAADLLYHLLVLLQGQDIGIVEVANELLRRRK